MSKGALEEAAHRIPEGTDDQHGKHGNLRPTPSINPGKAIISQPKLFQHALAFSSGSHGRPFSSFKTSKTQHKRASA
eukprot:1162035-Pelagomonas_calceolata.AAC.2